MIISMTYHSALRCWLYIGPGLIRFHCGVALEEAIDTYSTDLSTMEVGN